jgi:putative transposase
MKIIRAYKVELDPNNKQRSALVGHCGAARWIYNWALAQKKEALDKKEKFPKAFSLAKQLRQIRATECPWLAKYSSYIIDDTIPHVDAAFDAFFSRCKAGKTKKGFPKFKNRKKGIGSVRFHMGYTVKHNSIRLPKIGWIRIKEHGYIPTTKTEGVKFYSATVSEKAGRWFVSVQCEIDVSEPQNSSKEVVGVDFGIKTLAMCSNGQIFENSAALKKNLRKLKRLSRAVSRKQLGSTNRKKAVRQLARKHARIANIRKNALHQISHQLTQKPSVIVIEDLKVQGMAKNRRLSQAISDVGFYELRRQLTYKAAWRGCELIVAERWFASSKTCSSCGVVRETLKLSERTFKCDCGFEIDRDLNAAINLKKLAGATSDNSNACGWESAGSSCGLNETIPREAGTQQLILFGKHESES